MVNKDRFMAECELETMNPCIEVLHSAVCAHAASLSGTSAHIEKAFYEKARQMLEVIETLKDETGIFSISTLQAYILLASYEIKRGYCMRSCGTIHRAAWLSKLLKLHLLDSPTKNSSTSAMDRSILEEYRRTFWALVQLRAFTSVVFDWQAPPDCAEVWQ